MSSRYHISAVEGLRYTKNGAHTCIIYEMRINKNDDDDNNNCYDMNTRIGFF